MTATVLITRPQAQAEAFAAALEVAYGTSVRHVISPLIEIVQSDVSGKFDDVAHVVFTSVNGVIAAGSLRLPSTVTAWCVGDQTANAARNAGFTVQTSQGNSADLTALIVAALPSGRMVHMRGQHVAGHLVKNLQDAGITCEAVVAYDQVARQPTQAAIDLLLGETPVIVPIFSPRTGKLFSKIIDVTAPLHFVLISEAVNVIVDAGADTSRMVVDITHPNAMLRGTLLRYVENSP